MDRIFYCAENRIIQGVPLCSRQTVDGAKVTTAEVDHVFQIFFKSWIGMRLIQPDKKRIKDKLQTDIRRHKVESKR